MRLPGLRLPFGLAERWLDRHLFRIRAAEPLPAVLRHRRIFVLPTRAGLAFGATLITMLLASMNYSLSLGYGLTFLLAGVGVVSMHHAFRNLIELRLRGVRMDAVHRGQTAVLTAVIENSAARAREALELHSRDSEATRFALAPNSSVQVRIRIPAQHRGWLEPGRLVLETRYPLGLVRAWCVLTPAVRCLVYPAPESPPVAFPTPRLESARGHDGSQGRDDFAGLREYRPGDSPRHIAWKIAARNDTDLFTKQFRGGNDARTELDWDALPSDMDTEARLSRLTRWVIEAEAAGLPYGLRLPGNTLAVGNGREQRERALRALALHGIEDAG